MLAEFQISTEAFKAAFRSQVRGLVPPIDLQFADPTDGRLSVIDHIEIAPDTLMRVTRHAAPTPVHLRHADPGGFTTVTVAACRVHVAQSVDVLVAAIDDLKAAGAAPLAPGQYHRYTLPVNFDVVGGISEKGLPEMCIQFVSLGVSAPGISDLVGAHLHGVCTPFDLSALKSLLGYVPRVSNVGVSTDDDLSVLALRIELQSPASDTVAKWSAFWDGAISPYMPSGANWAMALDGETVTPALERKVSDGILAAGGIDLKEYPTVELTDTPGGVAITVQFGGDVSGASCTIHVDVTLSGSITLDADRLVSQMHADRDASDWDVFKCALKFALEGLRDGFVIGGTFGGFPGAIVGAISGAVIGFFAVVVAASVYKPDLPAPLKGCEKTGDFDYKCTFPGLGGISAGPLGTFTATTLRTDGTGGLVFAGTLAIGEASPAQLDLRYEPFGWGFIDVCSAGALHNWANVSISNLGRRALAFTRPREYGDTLDNFDLDPAVPSPVLGPSYTQWKVFSAMWAEYLALPAHYPAELLVISNGGARYLTIEGPPTPTAEDYARLKLVEELEREVRCKVPITRVFGGDSWPPAWLDDAPPPPGFPGGDPPYGPWVHGWHVFVGGAGPWGELVLEGAQGNPLATGVIVDGWTELTVGVTALPNLPDIQLRLAGRGNPLQIMNGEGRSVSIGQARFVPVGAFALPDPAYAITAARAGTRATVTVAMASGVSRYDVGDPTTPRLADRIVIDDVRSARIENGGVLLFTEHDAYAQRGREPLVRLSAGEVRERAALVPHLGNHIAQEEIAALVPAIASHGRRVVFAQRPGGGGVLVDVTVPTHPRLRARYAIDPWFVGLARAGTLHARLDATRTRITLYARTWTSGARRGSPNVNPNG